MTFSDSRNRSWLSSGSTPNPPYSYPEVPRPNPTSNRPPLTTSSVAVSSASRMGLCKGDTSTAVPSLILLVLAAICVATIRDDEPML